MTRLLPLALASLAMAGCAMVPNAPNVEGNPWPAGTPVPLNQPVELGDIVDVEITSHNTVYALGDVA